MPPKRARSKSASPKKPGMEDLTKMLSSVTVGAGVTATGAKKPRKSTRPRQAPVRLKAASSRSAAKPKKGGKTQLQICKDKLAKHEETIKDMETFLKGRKMWREYTQAKTLQKKFPFTDYGERSGAARYPRTADLGQWADGKVRFGKIIYYY